MVGRWKWCSHCERVYQDGEERPRPGRWSLCWYDGCGGSTGSDAEYYDEMREQTPSRQNAWPETPVRGVVYPRFPTIGDEQTRREANGK